MRALALLLLFALIANAPAQTSRAREKAAVIRAVQKDLAKHYASKIGKWKIDNVDVQGSWAIADVENTKANLAATNLLKKTKGVWKILVTGTDYTDWGKTYGVPTRLRKRWFEDLRRK